MIAAGLAGLAAGVATSAMNNYFSNKAADKSYARQRILMQDQNRMNNDNVYNSTSMQAQGARMAGFNPAMYMSGGTQAAPTVSQGNADMAQTYPVDVDSMMSVANLLKTKADIENVQADTNLKNTQAPNVQADTSLKFSQKLNQDASTEVQNQKAQEIKNINEQYADRNNTIKSVGPAMMDQLRSGLKEKGLWDKMLPRTRETIDAVADGELDISVGGLQALQEVIKSQTDLSDADRKFAENSLRNAVIYGQMSDKAVIDAMSKQPFYEAELKRVGIDKINADIDKVRTEIMKIVSDTAKIQSETEYQNALNKSFKAGDLDYLKSQGEYGKWIEKYSEGILADILKAVGSRGASIGTKAPTAPTPKVIINNGNSRSNSGSNGVQNFKYNKK